MKEFFKPFLCRLIQFGNSYKPPNRHLADGTLIIGEHTSGIWIISTDLSRRPILVNLKGMK